MTPPPSLTTGDHASDPTNDPSLRSWVESANDPATDFPIQNLPLCAFEAEHDGHSHTHLGTVIGDRVVDLGLMSMAGYFGDPDQDELAALLHAPAWNPIARRVGLIDELRKGLQDFLRHDAGGGQSIRRLRDKALRPLDGTRLLPPAAIFNYTDFYASKHHATNVGSMFRPDNPLLPNYVHVPIGYHGRASSIVLGGTPIRRPKGQTKADDAAAPTFGPCKLLDYEMELGLFVAEGNQIGEAIDIADAGRHMLGVCILNDWSARDLQKWEYQPLGPFLAKNFATSISPFIVTMQALSPYRVPGPSRSAGDPEPLEYLRSREDWALDITVEVLLRTAKMREAGAAPHRLSRGNAKDLYWTFAQMLTHHASNGCNLQPGDLLGSGTISGPDKGSRGCLLELTYEGNGPDGKPKRSPIELPTGEKRTFLEDGDEVIMRAHCQREGFRRIGFGECRGVIEASA
ncbi:MAG: fumarylacetoacetase [Phycisphaeraceae bacterium]|nr:fumarylacetoacetase [Phycisphaeraceae bacterium]